MNNRLEQLQKAFEDLSEEISENSSRVQLRIDRGMQLGISLAKVFPSNRLAVIIGPLRRQSLPLSFVKPNVKGLEVEIEDVSSSVAGDLNIVLELQDRSSIDIFLLFAARLCEVIEIAQSQKSAARSVFIQLEKWIRFFEKDSDEVLSVSSQIGLFGELYLLRNLIKEGADESTVLSSWTGCERTNQDFEFPKCAIECKATTRNNPTDFPVSNIRQLDSVGTSNLFLYHLVLDMRRGGNETLPSLIGSIRSAINLKVPECELLFEEKLLHAGYRNSDQNNYLERSYALRFDNFYEVTSSFPRLVEEALPKGVLKVKYSVSLDACQNFLVSLNKVLEGLRDD